MAMALFLDLGMSLLMSTEKPLTQRPRPFRNLLAAMPVLVIMGHYLSEMYSQTSAYGLRPGAGPYLALVSAIGLLVAGLIDLKRFRAQCLIEEVPTDSDPETRGRRAERAALVGYTFFLFLILASSFREWELRH
jgi:hypothetical protein